MKRRMVLLTEGFSNPQAGKTAAGLLRYCPDECLSVLDSTLAGQSVRMYLGAGGNTTFIARLEEAPDADWLVIGIAPPGGRIPESWRPVLIEAIRRGMNILSGLHEFLSDDPELQQEASRTKSKLIDVRKNQFKTVARREGIRPDCFRIHTVGHDCSVGKMVASLEITRELKNRGRDAYFIATGQTGIMIAGDGLPIDAIVSDFVSGAAEHLILKNQHHEILVVEGQGSLVHPSFSGVTLSLLHGCLPHALIFCFEAGRKTVRGLPHIPLIDIPEQVRLVGAMANIYQPCEVVGFAMNASQVDRATAHTIATRIEEQSALPVVDVLVDGPSRLVDAIESAYRKDDWQSIVHDECRHVQPQQQQ